MVSRSYAGFWYATVDTGLLIDNRIEEETNLAIYNRLGYQYESYEDNLQVGAEFNLRRDRNNNREVNEILQLFMDKSIPSRGLELRVGRFERSDNLGYYLLDGLQLNKAAQVFDSELSLYVGTPHRIEDVHSIDGQALLGGSITSKFYPEMVFQTLGISIDRIEARGGGQALSNNGSSQWLNLGLSLGGDFLATCCDHYDINLLGSYNLGKSRFEELALDGNFVIDDGHRIRAMYEYYRPEENDNPSFKERFYSLYALGNQHLFRLSTNYRLNYKNRLRLEGIRTAREMGRNGIGFSVGLTSLLSPNLKGMMGGDVISFGHESLSSARLSVDYQHSSQLDLQLDSIFRIEGKLSRPDNRVFGLSIASTYMIRNDLILEMEMSSVFHSRLRNEYSFGVNLTYYLEPFRRKTSSIFRPRMTHDSNR